jgi:hypothetical protein
MTKEQENRIEFLLSISNIVMEQWNEQEQISYIHELNFLQDVLKEAVFQLQEKQITKLKEQVKFHKKYNYEKN